MPALIETSAVLAKIEINDPVSVTVATISKTIIAMSENIPGGKRTTLSPALMLSVRTFKLSREVAFINKYQILQ